jgi:hypothetical protein
VRRWLRAGEKAGVLVTRVERSKDGFRSWNIYVPVLGDALDNIEHFPDRRPVPRAPDRSAVRAPDRAPDARPLRTSEHLTSERDSIDRRARPTDLLVEDSLGEPKPPKSEETAKPEVALQEKKIVAAATKEDRIAAACADWPRAPHADDDDAHLREHWANLKQRFTGKQLRQLYEAAVAELTECWGCLSDMEGWRPMGRPNFQRLLLAISHSSGEVGLGDPEDAIDGIFEGCVDWVAESDVISFGLILDAETRMTLVQAWWDANPDCTGKGPCDDPCERLVERWKREEEDELVAAEVTACA